jgi:hypothetical protein
MRWLERFTDEEIVAMVEAFFGASDGGARLAAWRAKLIG